MSVYNFPNGTAGLDQTAKGIANTVAPFIPMTLVFTWLLVFMGGFALQTRRSGSGDGPLWATLASLSTFLVSLVLTIKEGYMQVEVFTVVIGVTLVSAIWLFMSKGRYD